MVDEAVGNLDFLQEGAARWGQGPFFERSGAGCENAGTERLFIRIAWKALRWSFSACY